MLNIQRHSFNSINEHQLIFTRQDERTFLHTRTPRPATWTVFVSPASLPDLLRLTLTEIKTSLSFQPLQTDHKKRETKLKRPQEVSVTSPAAGLGC